MLIAVINSSTMCTNAQVQTMCQAIQIQLNLHVLPALNLKAGTITFYPDATKVPGYAWTIYVVDNDAQVQGALGFHQEVNDKISGYIMCEPILTNGGTVMNFNAANPGQYTVSGTLGHEAIECIGDRYTNSFFDNGTTSWCGELCDCVEQIGYSVSVNGVAIAVSDFVYPSFFNPSATLALNAPFNYLNTLKAPFTMLAGGYSIQRTGGPGTETQVFAENSTMPDWRKAQKMAQFSRSSRRMKK